MNNTRINNPCSLYLAGWLLYYLQGTLYTYGSIFAKVLLAVLMMYSIVFVFNNRSLYRTSYFRIVFVIIALIAVYTGFRYAFGETYIHNGYVVEKFRMLKNVLISFAPVLCYYGFARKGFLGETWFKWGALVLLLSAIASFYWEQSYRLSLSIAEGIDREEFTNNTGYLFAAIIPMLMLIKTKSWYRYSILIVALFFALLSMKRGAILVCSVASLIFIWNSIKLESGIGRIVILTLSIASIVFLFYGVDYLLETSDYFNLRIEQTREGYSSGRDELYSKMIDSYLNQTSFFPFVFGQGIDATGILFGNGAHNDWIEFAIDMGLIGLILYFVYWIKLFKVWRNSRTLGIVSVALGIIIVSEFSKSLFSFSINNMPIQLAPTFGYCLAYVEMNKKL